MEGESEGRSTREQGNIKEFAIPWLRAGMQKLKWNAHYSIAPNESIWKAK